MAHMHYQLIAQWLTMHPHWGGFLAFIVAFSESIAIIGSIVPGSVTMTAIGILLGSGVLPIWTTMIYAIAGAIIGDTLSYFAGYYFKHKIPRLWPFSRHPNALIKGQHFVSKHGGKSVMIGRFVGPVRAMVPLIAGMFNMPTKRYFLASIPAAIAWAPAYMLPGILLGAVSLEMPKDIATGLILSVLLILIAMWLLIRITNYLYQKTHHYFSEIFDQKWAIWRTQPSKKWFCHLLRHAERPEQRGQILLAINTIIASLALLILFLNVIFHGPLTHWNDIAYHLARGLRAPLLDKTMVAFTFLGDKHILIPAALLIFLWFIIRRQWFLAWHWLLGMLFALGSIFVFKHGFFSPRPTGILHQASTSSFPSGHTTLSVIFYGMLAFFTSRNATRNMRKYIYWLAFIIISLVALSRLYLTAHWLTDVAAGILLGLICLAFIIIAYHRHLYKPYSAKNIALASIIALSFTYTIDVYYHYNTTLQRTKLHWPTQLISKNAWWQLRDHTPPLYRKNRLGNPIEILNIEWAGNLNQIRNTLQLNGWKNIHTTSYFGALKQIAKQQIGSHKTLIPKLFQDQHPALEMVKFASKQSPPLILRLWHSRIQLQPDQKTLWVGTIYFDKVNKKLFFMHHHTNKAPTMIAAKALLSQLAKYTWRIKIVTHLDLPEKLMDHQKLARIILIQS